MHKRREIDFDKLNSGTKKYHKLPFVMGEHYVINPKTQCWEWILPYSTPYPSWKGCFVHQLAYVIGHGTQHYNVVCHKCDNKACINPHHLYNGDASSNARDKTYITEHQAMMILVMKKNGLTLGRIAQTLNIGLGVTKSIASGRHWITRTDRFRNLV